MLVLTRRLGERILIGDQIVLTVVRIDPDKVRLGISAPGDFVIERGELRARRRRASAKANPARNPPEERRSGK